MKNLNVDLHCDLLVYLMNSEHKIDNREMRCALPYLQEGNVKVQVMALYTATEKGSIANGIRQSEIFADLLKRDDFFLVNKESVDPIENYNGVGIVAAIENASNFCEEDMDLDEGFKNLDQIVQTTNGVLYMGITHHHENRFGGGNMATAGLKDDGKVLIDYLADQKMAIDLAHTSDQLAYDIFNYTSQRNYKMPILASHSNFRTVYPNNRNLPDELAKELIERRGLIGMNFIKDYIHKTNPEMLYDHIAYGMEMGAEDYIAYGADFYYDKLNPAYPRFFDTLGNAAVYPDINEKLENMYSSEIADKISHKNALNFMKKVFSMKS
ncbi:dipeptidase [Elizabethkingia meningoseptica]|uniref:dipeptidase n=1 Tax=Elizabethkingia meningoseptica TaxID=238 RepID=UPI002011A941|nr:membrane dipeptidase [Elizabethkingia meningoseptica]MCL1674757.1 membrane dipeptidase [Elizabethkingia meningoseptica]MCL1685875.1 membrane dipeptidase [Elizabethkingia meningoseptica]